MAISNNSTGLRPGVCTSTTRPTAPYEGQMIYETDTDMVAIWNGSAWRYISATTPTNGTVLQVVQTNYNIITASTTTSFADTGLTATITPKSANSKIFVMVNQSLYIDTAVTEIGFSLVRGATTLNSQLAPVFSSNSRVVGAGIFNYLDSPATTSATTYKTQFARSSGSGNVYSCINGNLAHITLFEVAA